MPLPELMLPDGFPDFKADTYEYTPGVGHRAVERAGGTPRRRVLHLNPPATAKAELELTQAQVEEFFAWHEGPLNAGERPFTARVPKLGPGVAYQEATCLAFQVEHREGVNNHLVSLTLRLRGEPEDSPPAPASLGSEVFIGLFSNFAGALASDFAVEVFVPLTGTVLQAFDFSAEVSCPLTTEFAGPVTNPSLEAEVVLPLQLSLAVVPGAELAAEVSVALVQSLLDDFPLAAEVSLPLAFNAEGQTGFVAAPGAVDVLVTAQRFGVYTVTAGVMAGTDGAIYSYTNQGGLVPRANWWAPTQFNVGSGKWVRASLVGMVQGGPYTQQGPVRGQWYPFVLGEELLWSYSFVVRAGDLTFGVEADLQFEVATDPDGANIVSSWSSNILILAT